MCGAGKRKEAGVAAFLAHLEPEVLRFHRDLLKYSAGDAGAAWNRPRRLVRTGMTSPDAGSDMQSQRSGR